MSFQTRVTNHDLMITDGIEAGGWIQPRLGGDFGAVTLQVPKGFEAYARIFHPASDPVGNPVRWAEVAKACGTVPHREMQWHSVVDREKWAVSDPPVGRMDFETLDWLCEILAAHTAGPTHCFFGLCTIQNWLEVFPAEDLQPLLELPDGRDHIVLTGPLAAVDQITFDWSKVSSALMVFTATKGDGAPPKPDPSELLSRETPNLIWPADRTWLVASEVDFDSTLVGGSAKLIEAIVESPELEAWPVGPTDSLAADADRVNVAKEN